VTTLALCLPLPGAGVREARVAAAQALYAEGRARRQAAVDVLRLQLAEVVAAMAAAMPHPQQDWAARSEERLRRQQRNAEQRRVAAEARRHARAMKVRGPA
jgi:hypothetical protein